MKKYLHAYEKLLEAIRLTESFDDLVREKDTAALFLNLARHFIPFAGGGVWYGLERIPLATRDLDPALLADVHRHITPEWSDYFRRELRPVTIPHQADASADRIYFALPLLFGWNLLGHAVLVVDGPALKDAEQQIAGVLAHAAGAALGRIEQAGRIEEERDRARGIFASIASALIVINEHGLVTECNAAAAAAFGRPARGQYYRDLFAFTSADPIRACLESGEAVHRVEAAAGDRIWGITVSPQKTHPLLRGAIVGFRDLTETRRYEEALTRAEREAGVGRLAATVAHEVNNPLGAMKAQIALLRQDLAGRERETRVLESLSGQIDRIARTVRLLLGFARQRAAAGGPVDAAEVIRTVAALFEEGFRSRGIRIELSLPPENARLRGETDRIQEVLVNLLENARELLPSGSTVRIALRADSNEVELTVEDDGPGLGADPEKVFEPFHTTRSDGSGLGLSIARRICEAHGGSLSAQNRPIEEGGGARFRIHLPAAP